MHVADGDEVRRGQLLLEDKKTPGVRFTSPGAGKVVAVHRGERRAFESVVLELASADRSGRVGAADQVSFESFSGKSPSSSACEEVKALLLESGEWTALCARPFGRIANPTVVPHSIFVTAMDTNPLAPDVEKVLEGRRVPFERGLAAMAKLTDGPVYVCTAEETNIPVPDGLRHARFRGPHPAGTVGYHIHRLDPVDRNKTVWYIDCQDVAAIGSLFETGELQLERVVSLAGPSVSRPRVVRTRIGASTDELTAGELADGRRDLHQGARARASRGRGSSVFFTIIT